MSTPRPEWFTPVLGIVGLLLVVGPVTAEDTEPVRIGFSGYPLKYQAVMNYDHPYPDIKGLYVNRLTVPDPAVRAGLREGSIIESINDTSVQTQDDVQNILRGTLGETVTLVFYQTTSRYRKKKRDNPLFKSHDPRIYSRRELTVRYQAPEPRRLTVVAGPNRHLYHRVTLRHSPDTPSHQTYMNPEEARDDELRPCPVCFPGQEESLVQQVLEDQLDASSRLQRELLNNYAQAETLPEDLKEDARTLFPLRLRQDLNPRLVLLETEVPNTITVGRSRIVLSRGILSLLETPSERAFALARLLGHMDLRHDPNPVRTSQFRSVFEEALQRTTGVSLTFDQLKDWAPRIPGFTYYRDILSQGYSEQQERAAFFLGMVYLHRAGYSFEGVDRWLKKMRDIEDEVHPHWLNFLLRHPLPSDLEVDVREWKKRIPKRFSPVHPAGESSSNTTRSS